MADEPLAYYRRDLALVHDLGFGHHAEVCAPGILALLQPVLDAGGTVLELACGSGLLTKHLVSAGHRVIATDASPAMLDLARTRVEGVVFERLVMPDDPMPTVDAIVSIGHGVSYLPDESAVERALRAAARALRPGGVYAIDVCDLHYGEFRRGAPNFSRATEDWAIITAYEQPTPARFVRQMATFVRNDDGTWRRDDERHDNVLIDTALVPGWLAQEGVDAVVGTSFGTEVLPVGLMTVVGRKRLG
jgi:SAM-dependent methyltransferase